MSGGLAVGDRVLRLDGVSFDDILLDMLKVHIIIQAPMGHDRSTKGISIIEWIRTGVL